MGAMVVRVSTYGITVVLRTTLCLFRQEYERRNLLAMSARKGDNRGTSAWLSSSYCTRSNYGPITCNYHKNRNTARDSRLRSRSSEAATRGAPCA